MKGSISAFIDAIKNYEIGNEMVQDYHKGFQSSSEQPKVILNKHNITQFKDCTKKYDLSSPYCQLDNCYDFGLQHDATPHWANKITTIFLRVVSEDGDIFKVPYSIKEVSEGFSGKNLVTEISSIKTVPDNATLKLQDALKA